MSDSAPTVEDYFEASEKVPDGKHEAIPDEKKNAANRQLEEAYTRTSE